MKQIIAMHGWGGDSTSWLSWHNYFEARGWRWQSGERGYGGQKQFMPNWLAENVPSHPSKSGCSRRVIIGHSLGPHLLEQKTLEEATDLVMLSSFGRFVPKGPCGRALRAGVQGMYSCLGTEQEDRMLKTFLTRAAHPYPFSAMPPGPIHKGLEVKGRLIMQQDLMKLIETEGLPKGLQEESRVLVVMGEDDAIVSSVAHSELIDSLHCHLLQAPCQWRLNAVGHALLIPELMEKVFEWLDSDFSDRVSLPRSNQTY